MTTQPSPTDADQWAAAAVVRHHEHMATTLRLKVDAVMSAATDPGGEWTGARDDLAAWSRSELVPHALAEEQTLYAAARDRSEGRLLIEGMTGEHQVILGLVEKIGSAPTAVQAAVNAHTLNVVFDNHLAKENTLVLPLLVSADDVSVEALLGGLHELVGN